MTAHDTALDAVVVGRAGADLYPAVPRIPLRAQRSFTRFVGGCGANIAVGLARLGMATALVTAVGDDGHGQFLVDRLAQEKVDIRYVASRPGLLTPLTFCELWPPDDFPVTMYRGDPSPDWTIDLVGDAVADLARARVLVVTASAVAREPSRSTTVALTRAGAGIAVVDLDWRPPLWRDTTMYAAAVHELVVPAAVVVGNEQECTLAGSVRALLDCGAGAVVVKRGPRGATLVTPAGTLDVPPVAVEVCNGLGAGDAFAAALGAALAHGNSLDDAVRDGAAAGAIVASRLACADAMPTAEEVRAVRRGTVRA